MADFGVTLEKERQLKSKMKKLGIREKDLEEKFIRASGKGGQKVNKSSSCVFLKHLPTGVSVKCQKERSRSLNRFFARRRLARKIENRIKGEKSEEKKRIEKIKRQKRKRSKRAKEKMIQKKKEQGQKKKERSYTKKLDAEEME
jgi:protein subunit release factor B